MGIGEITVQDLPCHRDRRGALTVAEFDRFVPFVVRRLFYVHDVPAGTSRGQHGHYRCRQYMICQSGRIEIHATDGVSAQVLVLSSGQAALIEPGILATETYLEAGSTLLVLCDRPHEKDDYIHTVEELLRLRCGG